MNKKRDWGSVYKKHEELVDMDTPEEKITPPTVSLNNV